MPHRVIRAGTQQHGPFIQEGEGLRGSAVSLETSHTGGGGHRPHPDLSRHGPRAQHGGGVGEGDTAHGALVTAQRLREQTEEKQGIVFKKIYYFVV